MRSARALAVAALLAALPGAARGADGPIPLRHDLRADVSITAAAAAVWVGGALLEPELAPARCRFCGTNALDASARELLVLGNGDVPRHASDVLAYGVLPAAVVAHQLLAARASGDWHEGGKDLLFIAEAAAIAGSVNELVKLSVGRQRPFVHYGNYADPDRRPQPDDNLSFYSGHTSAAFSVVAAAGTISTLRGYPSAPWIWAVGLPLAAGIGYLRIASDMHYLTDVLAGAAVGGAIGVAVPLLLHPREGDRPGAGGAGASVVPLPLGVLVFF
jgi:membrane-associated phospholipid phosphatase